MNSHMNKTHTEADIMNEQSLKNE